MMNARNNELQALARQRLRTSLETEELAESSWNEESELRTSLVLDEWLQRKNNEVASKSPNHLDQRSRVLAYS